MKQVARLIHQSLPEHFGRKIVILIKCIISIQLCFAHFLSSLVPPRRWLDDTALDMKVTTWCLYTRTMLYEHEKQLPYISEEAYYTRLDIILCAGRPLVQLEKLTKGNAKPPSYCKESDTVDYFYFFPPMFSPLPEAQSRDKRGTAGNPVVHFNALSGPFVFEIVSCLTSPCVITKEIYYFERLAGLMCAAGWILSAAEVGQWSKRKKAQTSMEACRLRKCHLSKLRFFSVPSIRSWTEKRRAGWLLPYLQD